MCLTSRKKTIKFYLWFKMWVRRCILRFLNLVNVVNLLGIFNIAFHSVNLLFVCGFVCDLQLSAFFIFHFYQNIYLQTINHIQHGKCMLYTGSEMLYDYLMIMIYSKMTQIIRYLQFRGLILHGRCETCLMLRK